MKYLVKMPFAKLYFVQVNPDGYLAWSPDKSAAMRFDSRQAVIEVLPTEVDESCFVLVEVES